MKIVTVGYLHGAGGAERQIVMLSNELADRGHDVHLIVLVNHTSPYVISDKVKVIDLTSYESEKGNKIVNRFYAFKRALKQICPKVTICYNVQPIYYCTLISSSIKGRVIYSERGDPYDDEYIGLLGKIRNFSFKYTDGFVFQSEGAQEYFNKKIQKRSIVIHNSVALPKTYEIPQERDRRIVSVGRMHPQKNIPLLIDAFAIVHKTLPSYKLDIYGEGEMRDEYQKKIDNMGLQDYITLNKSRKDIFDCIRTASLFVLSSDFEGMPNALMEAMALGLPCVATDCRPGGVRSLITDGENGFIVPRMNVGALAEKMIYVLSNKEIANHIAINARNILNTHSNKSVFDKWENFLYKIST
ncbi:MAG: glycosyltransferase [Candidatus Phocaeicola faecigallinarum]|uniref:Glycosyltransferase n=1 Tax=Candidatus Phocaeicola faecigallinarum TaxID=2838732 RepID=A0A948TDW5_9BACT|nr:glycosyltransferase [Candidatus Phocaeicola faecigallinarum]